MKKCPKCKIDMIIIQDDTPHPYSWGGFRLYGCQKCHRIYYQHLDAKGKESEDISDDELKEIKELLKKKKWIKKPIHDPTHHHDSHLIN